MNDHQHDKDGLDQLLQSAFRQHDEQPSDHVWQGIERDLAERRRRPFLLLCLLAGLLILAGSGIWVLYFSKEKPPRLEAQETKALEKQPESAAGLPLYRASAPHHAVVSCRAVGVASEAAGRGGGLLRATPSDASATPLHDKNQKLVQESTIETEAQPAPTSAPMPNLQAIESNRPAYLVPPTPQPPGLRLPPGKARHDGRLVIGLSGAQFATWQQLRTTQARPGTGLQFSTEAENPTRSLAYGLSLGYSLSRRWSIWSGIQWQRMDLRSVQHARLRLLDGQSLGSSRREVRFEYTMDTPSGGVDVDVRMEQSDPTLQLPAEEPVHFDLYTTQHLRCLSVPLTARYRMGHGRLQFAVLAGVAANFLISNNLEVTRLASRSQRFRPARFARQLASNKYLRPVALDYLLGTGLDYHLNRRLMLRMEPTFLGQLSSLEKDPFVKSSAYSLGLGAGVFYKF